jgi:pimeloyl-ACP methyl ester carboxylesterase
MTKGRGRPNVNKQTGPENGNVSDFCILNGRADARLSDVERLTLLGGSGLDRLLQRLGKSLSSVTLDAFAPGLEIDALKSQHEKLLELRSAGALSSLFVDQRKETTPSIVPIHGFPIGGVYDLEFHSTFPAAEWAHDRDYNTLVHNQTSYVRLWEHDTRLDERKTIIAIHGWTMGDQRVNSLAFLPGLFFSLGFNVAIVELPFHGRRRPESVDGHAPLFPSADPIRTCVAMAHAVHDLRTLSRFLAGRGHKRLACMGMSLGAYVGLLWASLDVLERGVFMVPLVSMGDMAWELVRLKHKEDRDIPRGMTKTLLRDLFADHYPLARKPATDQTSILVVGGRGDHLVPRNQISLLREQWPQAKINWASGGHAAPAQRGECFEAVCSFLVNEG